MGVRWNILNYGRIINLQRSEDARFQQLIVNYQNTALRAAREVEDAAAGFVFALTACEASLRRGAQQTG